MKYVEKELPSSSRVYQLFVESMNALVYSNTPEIRFSSLRFPSFSLFSLILICFSYVYQRSQLKLTGLLDLRDDIVIQFLQGDNFTYE